MPWRLFFVAFAFQYALVRPPRVGFDITFCDINVSISSSLNWKAKSGGNRAS